MKRILVTGATGLLGSSLVPALREQGHEVVRLGHAQRGDIDADLTDILDTHRALDSTVPDVIINLAALTDVDRCEREPAAAYRLNARIVDYLAGWIRSRTRSCHLIQISTDQVYGGSGPHREERVELINYYAFSKYAGELLAQSVDATVLRTNLFGHSRIANRQSLSDWLVSAMKERRPIHVFDDVLFSPLSLESLSHMIGLVVEQEIRGVFNLGSREGMSKADFAFCLARHLEMPTAQLSRGLMTAATLAARRPRDMRMDSSRFEAAFSTTLPTLESELARMKDSYVTEK